MNRPGRRFYSVIFLSCLLALNGCSSTRTAQDSDQVQTEAAKSIKAQSTPPQKRQLQRPLLPMAGMVSGRKVATMAMEAESSGISGGLPAYDMGSPDNSGLHRPPHFNRESYNSLAENPFIATSNDPLSTFSIDVDTASYANIRRILTSGQLPPAGAVRIEEMINYFTYNYPKPTKGPIGITTEVGPCPWQPENKLVRIGIKAKDLAPGKIPPSNLVFLIDVSGSMSQANKLPLLQRSMLLLLDQLAGRDRVSIVVYAGSDHVALQPTRGDRKEQIKKAVTSLSAGGSTHASSGILTAYELARENFIEGGNNRIILASDGDFNVGVTSRGELERLVAKERESGIYLTVLGFGMGNYQDDTMEILADKGNGNYSYIDSLLEAKKVLLKERAGTLFTLARDVKLQIEFNPARVGGYRLIGYENRTLADEDFNDDKKDAGEIGAGHTVTALYELLPVGSKLVPEVDGLRYQTRSRPVSSSEELGYVKLRYKPVEDDSSQLMSTVIALPRKSLAATSDDFRFAAAVAGFGMLLGNSSYSNQLDYAQLLTIAGKSRGPDQEGYRAEFIRLVEMSELLQNNS